MSKTKTKTAAITIAALGIVFGDIGTSPLYALHALFGPDGQAITINTVNVLGILSLILWSLVIVVSIKLVGFIMKLNNEGEGGIMALVGLIRQSKVAKRFIGPLVILGLVGLALFYGDSIITPAISVLSAVEGLKVIAPGLEQFVMPITIVLLSLLFLIQKKGTAVIGKLFGPVMLIWFSVIAIGGISQIIIHPDILYALSPVAGLQFFIAQPMVAFIAMGAVVLAITGAEALYADMGHFGRKPIARAWFAFVFPSLILCYMGQGALLLHSPEAASSPFFLLFPEILHIPVVILATMATLIASQSVISGAFSLTHQASQLNFMPRLLVKHTSIRETGQVYVPIVNAILYILVIALVLIFQSSDRLASAYGIAVSGTLAVDTILFIVIIITMRKNYIGTVLLALLLFLPIDLLFLFANAPKIFDGGWFSLVLAGVALLLMTTWSKGQAIVTSERQKMEGSLQKFIDYIKNRNPPVLRLPGQAVYISHHKDYAPLALHAAVNDLNELHSSVVIVSVTIANAAHVASENRAVFDPLTYNDGISHVELLYGYHDHINIPHALEQIRHLSSELDFNASTASYFVSMAKVVPSKRHNLALWRKSIYIFLSRNALSASDFYRLPVDKTVEMRSIIEL